MTRDELIEKVAKSIKGVENKYMSPTAQHYKYAKVAIDTIYAAMQEPSEAFQPEMISYHHGMSRLDWWQAMLAASPLAPEGGRE